MVIVNTVVVLAVLAALCWWLYRPKVQQSDRYQAGVMPLANIMDVGFLSMTPVIVVLMGIDAPLFMAALVAAGLAMGWVMRYNIQHYEPLRGTMKVADNVAAFSRWGLVGASIVNIAYYLQLLALLVLAPFGIRAELPQTLLAVGILVVLCLIGMFYGLAKLDLAGQRTTAFNLAAVVAILVGFLLFNIEVVVTGEWALPDYNPPNDPNRLRKLLGFFGLVQGFEASRYLGDKFDADLRCRSMRRAQIISGIVFVVLCGLSIILFVKAKSDMSPASILKIGALVSPAMPWIILLAAIGSQVSASVNAISNRSDVLIEASQGKIARRYTYPVLIVPCIALVLFSDIMSALSAASRVFAGYFVLQCLLAIRVAWGKKEWLRIVAFTGVMMVMAGIAIFGMSTDGTEAEQARRQNHPELYQNDTATDSDNGGADESSP